MITATASMLCMLQADRTIEALVLVVLVVVAEDLVLIGEAFATALIIRILYDRCR